jgi:hypothetical protein
MATLAARNANEAIVAHVVGSGGVWGEGVGLLLVGGLRVGFCCCV